MQIDDLIVVYDFSNDVLKGFKSAYEELAESGLKITLATYFGDIGRNLSYIQDLLLAGIHINLVKASQQLE